MTELCASVASGPLKSGYFVTVTFPHKPSDQEKEAVARAANRMANDTLSLSQTEVEEHKVTFEVYVREGHSSTGSGKAQFNEACHYFRTAWLQEELDSTSDGNYFIFY